MRDKTLTLDFGWARFTRHVADVPDPRRARGRRHGLFTVIALACAAMLAGRNTIASIERWARDAPPEVLEAVGCRRIECLYGVFWQSPSYDTFRRLLGGAAPGGVASLAASATELAAAPDDHVRIDGKRLRGAAGGKDKPLLVAALDSAARALGQIRCDDGDENTALRTLVGSLDFSGGALISADALHCCAETAAAVLAAGADYLLCLKGNRAALRRRVHRLPWKQIENAWESRDIAHGREETRTIKILQATGPAKLAFPGVTQIARVRRWTRDLVTGKVSHHTVYYLTSRSARRLRPAEFAAAVRNHWGVEAWHWSRDVTFGEDASQLRSGHGPENLASLRNLIIAVLKALDGQGITALRDQIANHPYTRPLEILGIALIEQTFQPLRLC